MEQYTDLDGNLITFPELTWLEDGRDNDGNHCARYAIGNEESVWLDWDGQEVERESGAWIAPGVREDPSRFLFLPPDRAWPREVTHV